MRINKIRQSNNPFIRILYNNNKLDVGINLIPSKTKDSIKFTINKVAVKGKTYSVKLNTFEKAAFELYAENKKGIEFWGDIKLGIIKNTNQYILKANNTDSIKLYNEIENKHILEKISIKSITSIGIAAAAIMIIATAAINNGKTIIDYKEQIHQNIESFIEQNEEKNFLASSKTKEEAKLFVGSAAVISSNNEDNDKKDVSTSLNKTEVNDENTEDKTLGYTYVTDVYEGSNVSYLVIDKTLYSPQLIMADDYSSVQSLVQESNSDIGINASAWNEDGNLDYTYVNGTWVSNTNDAYVGDPLVYANGRLSPCGYNYITVEQIDKSNPTWVATGYNAVIYSKYNTNSDWEEKYNRSFIGQLSNGDYIIGVMENANYSNMIAWARGLWGYDINVLYNLDGGESCGLVVNNESVYEGREVKNAICFVRNEL